MAETAPIVRSVEIAAPVERVFPLLVDPASLVSWWPDVAELEPRVGGRVRMEFRGGDSVVTGEVTRFEPPRALGFTWVRAERPEATTAIELTVTPLGDESCRVKSSTPGGSGRRSCGRCTTRGGRTSSAALRRWRRDAHSTRSSDHRGSHDRSNDRDHEGDRRAGGARVEGTHGRA